MATYYLYMIECQDGSLYTGYTTNIERRYAEHEAGSPKCKYTRAHPPRRLAASWKFDCDLSTILSIEAHVKKLSRQEKKLLIAHQELLYECW